jgi:chromosome segregation ATPase
MKNIISIISIFSVFLFLGCSCGQKQPRLKIQEIGAKESVVPKVKKSSEQLKSISQGANLGGEQILKLQIRTTNALFLAKKQEAKELEQKLQVISDELELLRKWNRNQSSDLRALENTLTDVEIALNIKEDETRQLRESNKALRKQTVKAQEDVIKVEKKILEVEAESSVKIAAMEKKIDALKKYRNICFGVGGLLALGIGFKLFGPRIF